MGQNLRAVEGWQQVLTDRTLPGLEYAGEAFTLLTDTGKLGEACQGFEWKIHIAGADTDDVTLKLYHAPDGVAATGGTEHLTTQTLASGAASKPYTNGGYYDAKDVGSGGVFTVQRSGDEADLVVNLWIRRYRYV